MTVLAVDDCCEASDRKEETYTFTGQVRRRTRTETPDLDGGGDVCS